MESSSGTNQADLALAAQLRKRRLELKLSQVAIASELGVDQSFVSRVELGERSLTFGQALKWLQLLYPDSEQLCTLLVDLSVKYGFAGQSFWNSEECQK